MTKKQKKYTAIIFIFAFIAAWVILISFVSPQEVVEKIGVKNTYLVIGAMAILGGVSSLTAGPFYTALATFAAGGANVWLLGLVAGMGLVVSDSVFFYLGTRGREILSGKAKKKEEKLARWIEGKPEWLIPIIVFVYSGLTPLPNDIMAISLAVIEYPYKKLFLPLLMGDVTSSIGVAALSAKGINLL
jgi:membrane protein YqaA with SNARE-associated domain